MSKYSIMVDLAELKVIHNWTRPMSIIEVRSFIELVGYYRCFVEGFSTIATPLTRLTHQDVPFLWSKQCEMSFQRLKKYFTIALILTLQVEGEVFIVYWDAFISGLS